MTEEATPAPAGPLVVGYDGRDESERALTRGLSEAQERGVGVIVLVVGSIPYEVVDPYDAGSLGMAVLPPIPPKVRSSSSPHRTKRAAGLASPVSTGRWSGRWVTPPPRSSGSHRERHASAIVVGTHHHSALGRFLGTDTAAELVRDAHCDVIVAHVSGEGGLRRIA